MPNKDKNDLLFVGELDQPLPVDDEQIEDVAHRIDNKIKQAIQEKNVYIALNAAKQLVIAGQLASWGLARILYSIESNWELFGIDEPFKDFAFEYIGKHPHTVERYVKVEKMFAEGKIPKQFEEEFRQKNIGDVVPIAHAISQGYDINKKQWKKLVNAPDYNTVATIVRDEIKHTPPRKQSLRLFLDREGSLWAYQDNHRYFFGSLEITAKEEQIQKAIERVINNAGITKQ